MAFYFIIFTILVRVVDVRAIGPEGSEVGYGWLNGAVKDLIGYHKFWYVLSKILGIISICLAALFGLLGAYQLIQSRSLKKVDRTLLALGVLYLVVIILYVFFNKAVVNYRPVLTDGELEASYPSSHTMLAVTVMGSAAMVMERVIRDRKLRKIVQRVCIFILILTVVSRLLSGVHWFTDILGSLLLSSALLMLFYAVLCMWKRPLKRGREEEY